MVLIASNIVSGRVGRALSELKDVAWVIPESFHRVGADAGVNLTSNPSDELEPWWDVFDVVEELASCKFEIPFDLEAAFCGNRDDLFEYHPEMCDNSPSHQQSPWLPREGILGDAGCIGHLGNPGHRRQSAGMSVATAGSSARSRLV